MSEQIASTYLWIVTSPKARKFALMASLLLLSGLSVGAYYYVAQRSRAEFTLLYKDYAAMAAELDNATYIPGAQTNPIRQQMDMVLRELLFESTAADRRLELATIGLQLLAESAKQLDTLSSMKDDVDAKAALLQVRTLGSSNISVEAKTLVAYAKERANIISDIRAYTYKANLEMQQIFERIKEDRGELTDEHIIKLNSQVPRVEQEFDKRTDLYRSLEQISQRMAEIFTAMQG